MIVAVNIVLTKSNFLKYFFYLYILYSILWNEEERKKICLTENCWSFSFLV